MSLVIFTDHRSGRLGGSMARVLVSEGKTRSMEWHGQIRAVNDLHDLLADAGKGYKETSLKADDARLKDFFALLGAERKTMEGELAAELRRFKPDNATADGTLKGEVHRAWIAIRDAMSGSASTDLLDECERGETYLLDRYHAVLDHIELASSTQALLVRQSAVLKAGLNAIGILRQELAATP